MNSTKQTQTIIKNTINNNSKNKKIVFNSKMSLKSIYEQVKQVEQSDKKLTFFSKSMLCSGLSTPKMSARSSRYYLVQKNITQNTTRTSSSVKMLSKALRTTRINNKTSTSNYLSHSRGIQSIYKQNFATQPLLTQSQKLQSYLNYKVGKNMSLTTQKINQLYMTKRKTNQQKDFEQFLYRLYLQKIQDLKGRPNKRQQILFVQRFKSKFIFYDKIQQEKANKLLLTQHQNQDTENDGWVLKVKQINTPNCDLGANCMRWICDFLISRKLERTSLFFQENQNYCRIKTIVLDQNPLGDEGVIILSKFITHCRILEKISLVSVNIQPKGGKQLLKSLIGLQTLKQANFSSMQGLSRNKFGQSIQLLQTLLSHKTCHLQVLKLSNVSLGNHGLKLISQGIHRSSTLKQLDLSANNIGHQNIFEFMNRLKFTQLAVLSLAHNQIGDEGFGVICEIVGSSSERSNPISRHIRELNLSSNHITSHGIDTYSKTMYHNQSLTHLYLTNNPLSKHLLFYNFKFYISKNWTLKHIDFSGCFENADDMRQLFEGLEENRALECLVLNKNNFNDQALVFLVKMLNMNKSLKSLSLQHCNLTDKMLEKCEKQLILTKRVDQINMGNNYLGGRSCRILCQLITNSKSLTKLSLQKNCMGTKSLDQIAYLLESNKTRRQLNRETIDDKEMEYLKYVAEMQARHEQTIKESIQRLKQQQQRGKLAALVCEVVKVQIEEQLFRKQLQQETIKIKHLQKKLTLNNNINNIDKR